MSRYIKYGPYICIGVVLAVLFVLWVFWGGKNYDFVGLAPLAPETCGSYTGSPYNWGNVTPGTNHDTLVGEFDTTLDTICMQENSDVDNEQPSIVIDNTPSIPQKFRELNSNVSIPEQTITDNPICLQEENIMPHNLSIPTPKISLPSLSSIQKRISQQSRTAVTKQKQPGRGRFISKGERLCCQTMERIYGIPFKTVRPDWLKNPETGRNLELDCYNDDLKIAVEYNGVQHYKWPNFTPQTYEDFINQNRRDTAKMDMCDRNGIYLIVVPYNVPHDAIPSFIMSHLPETIQERLNEEKILSNM